MILVLSKILKHILFIRSTPHYEALNKKSINKIYYLILALFKSPSDLVFIAQIAANVTR